MQKKAMVESYFVYIYIYFLHFSKLTKNKFYPVWNKYKLKILRKQALL